jgi:hypothetical protein
MKKLSMMLILLSVGFIVLSTVPSVFGQSFDLEITPNNIDELNDNSDVTILGTSDQAADTDRAASKPAKKGKLIVINESTYCADVYLDDKKVYEDLPAGKTLTLKNVPQGTHEFYASECKGGSVHWGPLNYTQGSSYTITLKNS